MVVITIDGAAITLVICPGNITHGVLTVGYLVTINYLSCAIHIATAADFVPRVVGLSVAVYILRHHYYASLIHTTKHQVLHFLIGVSPYGKVALARHVGDRMIEVERDITAPAAKCYQMRIDRTKPGQIIVTLLNHIGLGIASFVFRHIVYILSWGRAIFIYRLDVFGVHSNIVHALSMDITDGNCGY